MIHLQVSLNSFNGTVDRGEPWTYSGTLTKLGLDNGL